MRSIFYTVTLAALLSSCGNAEKDPRRDSMFRDSVAAAKKDPAPSAKENNAGAIPVADVMPSTCDSSIYEDYLPSSLQDFLEKDFSGWKLVSPSLWSGYWFDKYKTDSSLVDLFPADFNCDDKTDYALLMYNAERKETGLWIFIAGKAGFSAEKADVWENQPEADLGLYAIQRAPDRAVTDVYENKTVKPDCDAIDFVKFESASRVYYRANGKYLYVQTSD
ncbi:MAG TPA: hypothetical protein VFU15_12555 [Bacteroidia bacterium]|nr:hypothetical protein [Bacteroidia bacterium]